MRKPPKKKVNKEERVGGEEERPTSAPCELVLAGEQLVNINVQQRSDGYFFLENMVSPEKTLTDGQENQKGDGGQQSEGEGERAGEDLREHDH